MLFNKGKVKSKELRPVDENNSGITASRIKNLTLNQNRPIGENNEGITTSRIKNLILNQKPTGWMKITKGQPPVESKI